MGRNMTRRTLAKAAIATLALASLGMLPTDEIDGFRGRRGN